MPDDLLNPLLAALARLQNAAAPLDFFIRDDDAGWEDDRLLALVDLCHDAGMPIDLAAIPQAMSTPLAAALCRRFDSRPGLLGLHQHGTAHLNHQPEGRSCEFGSARDADCQQADLHMGRRMLQQHFGPRLDPFFTPPWNRCAEHTPALLARLGYAALSRDATAPAQTALPELPVAVDWSRHHRQGGPAAVVQALADALDRHAASGRPLGLMLHHAVMDEAERAVLARLLPPLARHPRLRPRLMRALLPPAGATPARAGLLATLALGVAMALGSGAAPAWAQARDAAAAPTAAEPAAAQAPAAPVAEGRRPDDRRPAQPTTLVLGGQSVQLTGSWEYGHERRRNFDLNLARDRNRLVHSHELQLEARWRPADTTEVFLQAVGLRDTRHTRGTDRPDRQSRLERGQTWVRFGALGGTPWSLQAGRVALAERRAWWWDEDLDALRLQAQAGDWRLDTGVSRQLAALSAADTGIAADQRGVQRWFGQATWQLARRHALDIFWLAARDRSGRPATGRQVANEDATDASDLDANWLGLRASGEHRAESRWRLAYWADTGLVRGHEHQTAWDEGEDGRFSAGTSTRRTVRGHAFDLGLSLRLPLVLTPTVTLGLARGSGGERSARRDANYRQTGLQENKTRLGGVKRWRRYGELLDPELSNLQVATLGLGTRFLDNSSAELVLHRYRQRVASNLLSGSRLSTDPLGRDPRIGQEIDLLIALREWQHWEVTLAVSRFRPGAAFAANRRDTAHGVELGLALNF